MKIIEKKTTSFNQIIIVAGNPAVKKITIVYSTIDHGDGAPTILESGGIEGHRNIVNFPAGYFFRFNRPFVIIVNGNRQV